MTGSGFGHSMEELLSMNIGDRNGCYDRLTMDSLSRGEAAMNANEGFLRELIIRGTTAALLRKSSEKLSELQKGIYDIYLEGNEGPERKEPRYLFLFDPKTPLCDGVPERYAQTGTRRVRGELLTLGIAYDESDVQEFGFKFKMVNQENRELSDRYDFHVGFDRPENWEEVHGLLVQGGFGEFYEPRQIKSSKGGKITERLFIKEDLEEGQLDALFEFAKNKPIVRDAVMYKRFDPNSRMAFMEREFTPYLKFSKILDRASRDDKGLTVSSSKNESLMTLDSDVFKRFFERIPDEELAALITEIKEAKSKLPSYRFLSNLQTDSFPEFDRELKNMVKDGGLDSRAAKKVLSIFEYSKPSYCFCIPGKINVSKNAGTVRPVLELRDRVFSETVNGLLDRAKLRDDASEASIRYDFTMNECEFLPAFYKPFKELNLTVVLYKKLMDRVFNLQMHRVEVMQVGEVAKPYPKPVDQRIPKDPIKLFDV